MVSGTLGKGLEMTGRLYEVVTLDIFLKTYFTNQSVFHGKIHEKNIDQTYLKIQYFFDL